MSAVTHRTKCLLMAKTITRNQLILVLGCRLFLLKHVVLGPKIHHPAERGVITRVSSSGVLRGCPERQLLYVYYISKDSSGPNFATVEV
jgi:hypothetical protein